MHLTRHIEAFQQRHEERLREKGGTEGISRAGEISFTDHIAEQDAAVCAFCTRREPSAITTTLLGPDIDLYWNQSVFKAPEGNKEFPWHQDDGYIPATPSPYVTLWLALNDATLENGCIRLFPDRTNAAWCRISPATSVWFATISTILIKGYMSRLRRAPWPFFPIVTFHKSGVNRLAGHARPISFQYSHAGLRSAVTGELIDNKIALARNGRAAELAAA